MKKTLSMLTILFIVASCFVIAFAQPRGKKRNSNINRGVARTQGQPRSAIGAGGAGTYARNRRGRWVTRNGKRIWVPQGSPVVEREQLEVKKNQPASNTNRP
jgi:hypothetical protein